VHTLSSGAVPRRSPQVILRPQDDSVLVYNAATDQLHSMRPLGAEVLKRCDGTRTPAQIAAEAFAGYSTSVERREALTRTFLEDLERRKLVTWQADDDTDDAADVG
jgi:hypothetical protein